MPPSSSMLWPVTNRSATIWIAVRNGSSAPLSMRSAMCGSMIAVDTSELGSAIFTSWDVSVSGPLPPDVRSYRSNPMTINSAPMLRCSSAAAVVNGSRTMCTLPSMLVRGSSCRSRSCPSLSRSVYSSVPAWPAAAAADGSNGNRGVPTMTLRIRPGVSRAANSGSLLITASSVAGSTKTPRGTSASDRPKATGTASIAASVSASRSSSSVSAAVSSAVPSSAIVGSVVWPIITPIDISPREPLGSIACTNVVVLATIRPPTDRRIATGCTPGNSNRNGG